MSLLIWKALPRSRLPVCWGGKAWELSLPFEIERGNCQVALSRLDALLQRFSKTEMAMHLLFQKGMIYKYDLGDVEEAQRTFRNFIEEYPDDELARLAQVELDSPIEPKLEKSGLATGKVTSFTLSQSYPNPGNPSTTITFTLPQKAHVTLEIYNLLGQRVRTLVDGAIDAGSHTVVWDGRDEFGEIVPTGIYLYRLQSADFVRARKMVLVR